MSELLGIDMPEFQLQEDRRNYLRTHGTLIKTVNDKGRTVYSTPVQPSSFVDDDGTLIYLGKDEVVRRNQGMCVIEQTPQWILRVIMQHAKGTYAQRHNAIWPATVWNVQYGIRYVLETNKVDDDAMPLNLRKALINDASPLISRFLIRANPEYAKTHFIGIRRPPIKTADEYQDELDIVDRKKSKAPTYCLDDYLFPELKGLTADAVTAPGD